MSGLQLTKPWNTLDTETISAIPAQLGVYQIGDDRGTVVRIGYAGGRQPFGLRSALGSELEAGTGTHFRHELTHGYLTRWEELLMLHQAEHGELPPGNADRHTPVGRLRPGS
ncbi:MAG: hypothetical protein AAFO29_02805 [Actinomycetota bacterium]